MMHRTQARAKLMQMLFQMEAQRNFSTEARDLFFSLHMGESPERDYVDRVYSQFATHRQEIDSLINQVATSWKTNRMAKVDLAVLRLCTTEILFLNDAGIPKAASINEAVNLAKAYGTEESGKFVNGILGRLAEMTREA